MIVEKLPQLLAQAFIPLGLVTQHDCPLEQRLLEFAWKLAPQIEGSQPQHVRKSIGVRFSALDWSHYPSSAGDLRSQTLAMNLSSPAMGAWAAITIAACPGLCHDTAPAAARNSNRWAALYRTRPKRW